MVSKYEILTDEEIILQYKINKRKKGQEIGKLSKD